MLDSGSSPLHANLEGPEKVGGCCEELMRLKVGGKLLQCCCVLLQDILDVLRAHKG